MCVCVCVCVWRGGRRGGREEGRKGGRKGKASGERSREEGEAREQRSKGQEWKRKEGRSHTLSLPPPHEHLLGALLAPGETSELAQNLPSIEDLENLQVMLLFHGECFFWIFVLSFVQSCLPHHPNHPISLHVCVLCVGMREFPSVVFGSPRPASFLCFGLLFQKGPGIVRWWRARRAGDGRKAALQAAVVCKHPPQIRVYQALTA